MEDELYDEFGNYVGPELDENVKIIKNLKKSQNFKG